MGMFEILLMEMLELYELYENVFKIHNILGEIKLGSSPTCTIAPRMILYGDFLLNFLNKSGILLKILLFSL